MSKNTKWDLIWIIPEIIGSIAIPLSAALHIQHIPSHEVIGLMGWIYQLALVMVVLYLGGIVFGHAIEEFKEVIKNARR